MKNLYDVASEYKLYFNIYLQEDIPVIKDPEFKVRGGFLLTEENLEELSYKNNHLSYYRRLTMKKFATNQNDLKPEFNFIDFYKLDPAPLDGVLFVWLGTSDFIYNNSGRIVSHRDAKVLAKGHHGLTLSKGYMRRYRWNRRKYGAGHSCSYRKHSYVKNHAKIKFSSDECYKEYPHQFKISSRDAARLNYFSDWDDYPSKTNNGWKDNTKVRKQYLRHQK